MSASEGLADAPVIPVVPQSPEFAVWVNDFLLRHFSCSICHKVLGDNFVILYPNATLGCRECLNNGPLSLAVPALGSTSGALTPSAFLKAVEALKRLGGDVHPQLATPQQVIRPKRQPQRTTFTPQAASECNANDAVSPSNETPRRLMRPPSAAQSPAPTAAMVSLQSDEDQFRSELKTDEAIKFLDLSRKVAEAKRNRKTSRDFKCEADEKYEKAEYAASCELYSRALLETLDRTTKAQVLHGNRSAAYFMAGRYAECISDCLQVAQLDPTNSSKMLHRAVKAATLAGDLDEALRIVLLAAPNMQQDREKLEEAIDNYNAAMAQHPQGGQALEERWQVLIAKFPGTVVFRVQLAEAYAFSKRYEKAVEVLSVESGQIRSAVVGYRIAKYLYSSGFEHFDRARLVLEDVRLSPECLATVGDGSKESCDRLISLLNLVDDEKQKGNNLFSTREYGSSVTHYTRAIDADPSNARVLKVLYCNRAAAFKELGRARDGVEDCSRAIICDPHFSKAYARRARCSLQLSDYDAAIRDFKRAIQYEPGEDDLQRELRGAEASAAKEVEREKDYYYVLGVSRTTAEKEIKMKYRELSLRWHPDKCVSLPAEEKVQAERKFKVVGEAYSVLSDPLRRQEYDRRLDKDSGKLFTRSSFSSAQQQPNPRSGFGRRTYEPGPTNTASSANYW